MKKTNNKGFTLVELIVVLVILAILAAILVPALLGYIDKAREKQVTTNAEAAYVAAQALATEAYGKNSPKLSDSDYATKIKTLTDIEENFSVNVCYKNASDTGHDGYIISGFKYTAANGREAVWLLKGGTVGTETVGAGGWSVIEEGKTASLTAGNDGTVTVAVAAKSN